MSSSLSHIFVCIDGSHPCIVIFTHLGHGPGDGIAKLAAPLLTSGLLRYDAVLHSCGTLAGWYRLVTGDRVVPTHGDFIVLPQWDIRPPHQNHDLLSHSVALS